ncbi:serine hydrolase [Chitinophagaceae bacterium IBVUCB2]|nr:serine hydrolase [Chitinophagaceae bacterium IBVUCB2]
MKYILVSFLLFSVTINAQSKTMLDNQLDSLFGSYFKNDEPGGAVLLLKDNKVVWKRSYGVSDIETKEKVTTNTLFNVGSISKTVVAYGILKLAAEKKLSLDDNLYKYFPDFRSREIAEKVKIYHLLTHTSGIPDSRKVKEENDFYLIAKDEENFAPLKATTNLDFEPGTKYKYSNPCFNGLALIIEKVSGMKWQDFIKQNIFNPAGMKTSDITDGSHPATGVSHGHIKNNKGKFKELDYGEEPTFAAAGNGGVWSSVEELWLYEQAIQKSSFISSDWITVSRTIYPFLNWKDAVPQRLGLSWFLTKEMNMNMIGHTGSQGGFISDYCWLPTQKVFYVLLCNTPKPIIEIRNNVFTLLSQHKWLD